MRAITPTLRAAATRWGGRAAITAEVQDRRTRWVLTRHTVGASMGTDMAFCGGGLGDAGLHRVAVDASGQVLYCRVRDLAAPAEWTAWAVLASGACPGGDVALAVVDGAARHLRLCYAAPDGAGGYAVRCLESADGGAHWSAGPDVVRSLAVRPLGGGGRRYGALHARWARGRPLSLPRRVVERRERVGGGRAVRWSRWDWRGARRGCWRAASGRRRRGQGPRWYVGHGQRYVDGAHEHRPRW